MRTLVTGGSGFNRLAPRGRPAGGRPRGPGDRQLLHRRPAQPGPRRRRCRDHRGRSPLLRTGVDRRARLRRRLPRGSDAERAALGRRPLDVLRGQCDRDLNVLLASRDSDVQRVVYASSSSVYGSVEAGIKHEERPIAPMSPYAVSKYAGEANCRAFWQVYGMETVALRYFNVFGPRQNPVSEYAAVVPNFIAAALLGEQPTVHGDGRQSRDFTYVDNVVAANLLAAATPDIGVEVFNVAMGTTSTLLDLLDALAGIADQAFEPSFIPRRPGDVLRSHASIEKAQRVLGYRPVVEFREGLRRAHDHMATDETLLPRIAEARRWMLATSK